MLEVVGDEELVLEITAADALVINKTSNAAINRLLATLDVEIRETAKTSRMLKVYRLNGSTEHVSYDVAEYTTFKPSVVGAKLIEVLQKNGFSARFESEESYIARGDGQRYTPYYLAIRW